MQVISDHKWPKKCMMIGVAVMGTQAEGRKTAAASSLKVSEQQRVQEYRVGFCLVVSVFASRTEGREFASRPGHTKDLPA